MDVPSYILGKNAGGGGGSYTETDPTVPTYVKQISQNDITNWNNKSNFSGNYNDLSNKPDLSVYATNTYVNSLIGNINTILATLTTISGGGE